MIEPAAASPEPPPRGAAPHPTPESAEALTPEEQMERFERALYEADSGHQPC